ncbi:helix-turn-helix transcriptional regulator [Grimontia hollisae]|uniref:LuxR family transcriptional regulatory, chaperone HchA-associated n=1 Tax=Grimontia hollisae TaxID=673 RepID=A0A377J9B6_GRIHO|nr:helix-turn-helix transcriptional regulator [Grimontia hollisae]MDF2184714.1 helix-turn-helix transcriptional regulator [Grimontia hollisae]STO98386.1 LuxR family transcriptional regulatory, chaperone HchA-associated [Grimontia hollisae]STQ75789.1 LuxR family transcriptional regulatory, chaperone HchA-associated [Grimontia hollisae]
MNHISLLPPILISLFEQLPGCWGCKDTESRFVYLNYAYAKLLGAKTPEELIGKSDEHMPGKLAEYAIQFRQQDKRVMDSGRYMRVLNIHPYPDGRWQAHVFTKVPWYGEKGEVLGTIFHGQPLDQNPMLEVGQWICKAAGTFSAMPFITDGEKGEISLSPRESEVLFFHLFGKKPQFIAHALGVSVKTVENHFANLRIKLGAATKTELVDKALESGVGCKIPASLLKQQLTLILSD